MTPWTVANQVPLSMGFSRQEYWSGMPCPPLGGLLNPGVEPCLLHLLHGQAGSLPLAPPGKPQGWEHPLEEEMATHSSILLGESHGQRSLVGYSPQGCQELDTTEQLTLSLSATVFFFFPLVEANLVRLGQVRSLTRD